MADLIVFKPKHKLDCEKNLNDFVSRAKNDLIKYEDQGGFDVTVWRNQIKSGQKLAMSFCSFTDGIRVGEVFEQPYLDFARAYIRDLQSWKERNPANYMLVLKSVYESLLITHGNANILLMDNTALRKCVEILEGRVTKDVTYRAGQVLEGFLENLITYGINYQISKWKNPWKRPREKAIRTDTDSRKWQEERLLSEYDIGIMADAFRLAKTLYQKYYSSLMVLLMATPSRGGELSFLTTDCLFEEVGLVDEKNPTTGLIEKVEKTVLRIRWYAEKGGGYVSKPIHPALENIVKEAVQRLIEISDPARKAAEWAIKHPNKFYLQAEAKNSPITVREFFEAMTLNYEKIPSDVLNAINIQKTRSYQKAKWISELVDKKEYITYTDLATYTVEKYSKKFPHYPKIYGSNELISHCLCLIRENEFHKEFNVKEYSFEIPSLNVLNDALGVIHQRFKDKKVDSLFSSLGLTNEDGTPFVITSHQIRVWISTQAERGGMDAYDLARFAGRARIQDNIAYDLRPMEELHKESRRILELATSYEDGTKALSAVKANLPVSFEMLGNKDRIGTVQVTAWGFCEHDWAMTPCSKAGECVTCKEHACVKGLPKSLEKLQQLEQIITHEIQRADGEVKEGTYGANKWLIYHTKKLAVIKTLITMMDNDNLPDGYVIRIPAELDESMTKIALREHGLQAEVIADKTQKNELVNSAQNDFLSILRANL